MRGRMSKARGGPAARFRVRKLCSPVPTFRRIPPQMWSEPPPSFRRRQVSFSVRLTPVLAFSYCQRFLHVFLTERSGQAPLPDASIRRRPRRRPARRSRCSPTHAPSSSRLDPLRPAGTAAPRSTAMLGRVRSAGWRCRGSSSSLFSRGHGPPGSRDTGQCVSAQLVQL